MAELHERYAGVPGPTDVLAFPLADDPVLLGEVLVSAETARREAAARGHPAYDELLLYAVHGVLHLVGHDDHEPADRRRMRAGRAAGAGRVGRRAGLRPSPTVPRREESRAVNPAEANEVRRDPGEGALHRRSRSRRPRPSSARWRPWGCGRAPCRGARARRATSSSERPPGDPTGGDHGRRARPDRRATRSSSCSGAAPWARVYKARQVSLDRIVALKVLDPDLARGRRPTSARFLEEARAVARLSHTNLICGHRRRRGRGGVQYLVMEYADGVTLARLLHRGGAMDEERALLVAQQMARALDHAHKNGLVHGDVRARERDHHVRRRHEALRPRASPDGRSSRRTTPSGDALERTPGLHQPGAGAWATPSLAGAPTSTASGATLFHMLTGRGALPLREPGGGPRAGS